MNRFLVKDLYKDYINNKARIILKLDENIINYNECDILLSDEEGEYFKKLLNEGVDVNG